MPKKRVVIKATSFDDFVQALEQFPEHHVEAMCTMGCFIIATLREPDGPMVVNISAPAAVEPQAVAAKVVEEVSRASRKNRR